ncbi:MAG: hypothetical protein J5523_06115 [Muribaculaceae bacterium]|nr:hypothetical protein [Muribaculaceae bacterium]
MEFKWIDNYEISVKIQNESVILSANKEGLLSLANHLTALANDESPRGHFHLDEYNSLEEHSAELIIERTE